MQLVPFAYLAIYSAYLLLSPVLSDSALGIFDSLIFLSPATSGGLLVISRLLKLCKWHRAAVLIPLSSQVEGFVDSFVFTFTENEVLIINILLGIVSVTYIYLSFRHFFHGRKENSQRNPRLLQVQD